MCLQFEEAANYLFGISHESKNFTWFWFLSSLCNWRNCCKNERNNWRLSMMFMAGVVCVSDWVPSPHWHYSKSSRYCRKHSPRNPCKFLLWMMLSLIIILYGWHFLLFEFFLNFCLVESVVVICCQYADDDDDDVIASTLYCIQGGPKKTDHFWTLITLQWLAVERRMIRQKFANFV